MMLVIRDAQRAALQLDTDVRWYEARLSQWYPSFAQAGLAQRQQWVREGVARAKSFGLARAERLQFLCFEQTFGPACIEQAEYAWARRLITQPGVPPAERMKALRQATIHRLLQDEAAAQQGVEEDEFDRPDVAMPGTLDEPAAETARVSDGPPAREAEAPGAPA